ncbi:hypothetical protein ACHAPT_008351 [Fusarium lateritium]
MIHRLLWIFWAFISGARADDDGLSDFSNDLATDLAPLLTLFGDAITKQYLSESTSFLDYLIFAMGPIGVLAAMVSTIRVCGHSSLRAFIGRSQEGEGTIEAELCTSTSRDVCELFNRGGIARVLGRPNVLELVYTPWGCTKAPGRPINDCYVDGGATLNLSRLYFNGASALGSSTGWKRTKGTVRERSTQDEVSAAEFAPNPNLSLNIGIVKRPKWVYIAIAATGVFLQAGVLVLAGVGVWVLGWNLNGGRTSSSKNYAPAMFISGTVLMCLGMWGCAYLIGQTTTEIRFQRCDPYSTVHPVAGESRLFWLQPGPQVIGDQSFDSFGYAEDPANPIRVWMSSRKEFRDTYELGTYFAVLAVLIGYIVQFIGLRGMKAWVSIAQLGICIIMSILRGCLRMQRLDKGSNQLADRVDIVSGHELDWLSHQIVPQKIEWVMDARCAKRRDNSERVQSQEEHVYVAPQSSADPEPMGEHEVSLHKLVTIRKRLAQLTGQASSSEVLASKCQRWKDECVKVRAKARQISAAICQVAEEHLYKVIGPGERDRGRKYRMSIPMVAYDQHPDKHRRAQLDIDLHLPFKPKQPMWELDPADIEAILGLWMWALVDDPLLKDEGLASKERMSYMTMSRIVSLIPDHANAVDDVDHMQTEMGFWSHTFLNAGKQSLRLGGQPWYSLKSLWTPTSQPPPMDKHYCRVQKEITSRILGRYCGWTSVQEALRPSLDSVFRALVVKIEPDEDSLLDVLAQDLLTALLVSLARHMVIDKTNVVTKGGKVRFENSTVNDLVDAFAENGISSHATAFLCIIPALRERLVLPPPQDLLDAIISAVDWSQMISPPISWLEWSCVRFSSLQGAQSRVFEQALRAVGEFCRTSPRRSVFSRSLDYGFSRELILRMYHTFSGRAKHDLVVKDILECYQDIVQRLARIPKTEAFPNQGEVHSQLLRALKDGDRTETLYSLCFIGPGAFRSNNLQSALPLAVRNDWGEVVKDILRLQADPNSRDEDGRSSASHAAELGFEYHLKTLVGHGANLDLPDNKQQTPLYYAAENGHEDVVKLLVGHGSVDIHRTNKEGHNALWAASKHGHKTIMEDLLERRVSPDSQEGEHDQAPCFYAAHHGYMDLALNMLVRMSQWEDADQRSELLEVAVANEYTELIDKLRSKRDDVS